jgi:hypothetical protein
MLSDSDKVIDGFGLRQLLHHEGTEDTKVTKNNQYRDPPPHTTTNTTINNFDKS